MTRVRLDDGIGGLGGKAMPDDCAGRFLLPEQFLLISYIIIYIQEICLPCKIT